MTQINSFFLRKPANIKFVICHPIFLIFIFIYLCGRSHWDSKSTKEGLGALQLPPRLVHCGSGTASFDGDRRSWVSMVVLEEEPINWSSVCELFCRGLPGRISDICSCSMGFGDIPFGLYCDVGAWVSSANLRT